MISLYNSLTKKKEEFVPLKKGIVKLYSCGPTVYNYVHIGNLRSFVFTDILVRTLAYFSLEVQSVMNITDVDDKTIKGSQKELKTIKDPNKRLEEFTQKYTQLFFKDADSLNIKRPWTLVKATKSMQEIEYIIGQLLSKGFAYVSDDGIYFDVRKDKNYGQLTNVDFKHQQHNQENRIVDDEYDRDNIQDFALWKFKKKEEPSWKIKLQGKEYEGRPGWHIECSAMNFKVHGSTLDIHTGGVDLTFPHHENEIAQSECAHSVRYVNYWLHNGFLLVDGKKMSKSLNNFYTLKDLNDKGHNPLALRQVFLRSHYRAPLNFTLESLKAAEIELKKMNDFYQMLESANRNFQVKDELPKEFDKYLDKFEEALKDDLNTPEALAAVNEFMNIVNKKSIMSENDIELAKKFILRCDKILGLLEKQEEFSEEVFNLAKKRQVARVQKKFDEADKLRGKIEKLGFEVKDSKTSKEGFILKKI